eukprot:572292-Pelagomonas_calceolata.AAC.1
MYPLRTEVKICFALQSACIEERPNSHFLKGTKKSKGKAGIGQWKALPKSTHRKEAHWLKELLISIKYRGKKLAGIRRAAGIKLLLGMLRLPVLSLARPL